MRQRIPTSPPSIKPVSNIVDRPEWSVMIPAYNCSKYLPDAINSVLIQNISEERMQIEVVDDASTDADVEEIVNRLGKGRVKYFRQPENVGSLRNFETCINRSKGKIVHLLHGDDRVKFGYYDKIGSLFYQYPDAGAACCRYNYIDEEGNEKATREKEMDHDGILENWLLRIAEACSIQYVSIAVKRDVYEKLGAFYGLTYGEDWEMWVRMAQFYAFAYTPQVLADYREHNSSITGIKFLNGGVMKDTLHVFSLIQKYLPPTQREATIKRARERSAFYGLHIARNIWYQTRNVQYVNANIKQVMIMCGTNRQIYKQVLRLFIEVGKDYIKKQLM
jgi:glycosyltransferase involved in cell wall biosynthesis